MTMKTLSLKISEVLEAHLRAFAEERGISKSEVVREALVSFFRTMRPAARGFALALVEDLVGSVEGPPDLSSNPAYLDDCDRERR